MSAIPAAGRKCGHDTVAAGATEAAQAEAAAEHAQTAPPQPPPPPPPPPPAPPPTPSGSGKKRSLPHRALVDDDVLIQPAVTKQPRLLPSASLRFPTALLDDDVQRALAHARQYKPSSNPCSSGPSAVRARSPTLVLDLGMVAKFEGVLQRFANEAQGGLALVRAPFSTACNALATGQLSSESSVSSSRTSSADADAVCDEHDAALEDDVGESTVADRGDAASGIPTLPKAPGRAVHLDAGKSAVRARFIYLERDVASRLELPFQIVASGTGDSVAQVRARTTKRDHETRNLSTQRT